MWVCECLITHADRVKYSALSVCLSVCLLHNLKTNDPKVFKLGVGISFLGYPWDILEMMWFWG